MMNINEPGVSPFSVRYFFTPSSFAERIFFYPTRIGHYLCDRAYHFSCRSEIAQQASHHLNLMFFVIKQGLLELQIEGTQYRAERGDMVLFDCKRPHEYRALTDNTEFYWLLFNGMHSETFFHQILALHGGSHVFTAAEPQLVQQQLTLLLAMGETPQRAPEHTCAEAIYTILCELLAGGGVASGDGDALISRSIAYMDQHYDAALSVNDVAFHIGLSASYFTKLFRQSTGYSPYEYLLLRRIDHAKALLLSSAQTVRQIAFETGFNSEENFIRAFKKKVGLSPSGFRKYPV